MKKYLILPGSGDLNRGDQALVWETIKVAKNAECLGEYYILSDNNETTKQSQAEGIRLTSPILKHPSRKFKSKENNEYNTKLVLKWGSVAILDFIFSLLLLSKLTRSMVSRFMSDNEKKTLKIMTESEVCFVKGGGFIHSAGKPTDFYTVYFQLFHILLAQSLGKPVYIMPNSFGPFNGLGVAWLVRKALRRCKLVTVREDISKEMLEKLGVEAHLYPDLGFGLDKRERENHEVRILREKHPERKLVAITARPYRFPGSDNPIKKYKDYVDGMAMFSKWLYSKGYFPVFIEHTLSETTHENDGTSISEIVSKIPENEFSIISNRDYTCRDLKAIYSEFDYVVGTRFHSVIFSLAEEIPSIAITYGGNKGQGIMRDLGLSEYAISMSEFDLDKMQLAFTSLDENREHVCLKLAKSKELINQSHIKLTKMIEKQT
ncbi:polysaccharide pyruvyl transferase family protein [Sporosarcina luteola]|uniref:polysaccharide pyruvyl transferase family protein n=1 Tax=Sporosarcina luteola TaxID=582850 RepID=UPI00203E59B2|nr:polysaccharide pyruvyl transferase family protein [Sporosarcina luteola]MCM3744097.1 polysaccharide pyruvyl transferase family protein [Sporosarcina luteola]